MVKTCETTVLRYWTTSSPNSECWETARDEQVVRCPAPCPWRAGYTGPRLQPQHNDQFMRQSSEPMAATGWVHGSEHRMQRAQSRPWAHWGLTGVPSSLRWHWSAGSWRHSLPRGKGPVQSSSWDNQPGHWVGSLRIHMRREQCSARMAPGVGRSQPHPRGCSDPPKDLKIHLQKQRTVNNQTVNTVSMAIHSLSLLFYRQSTKATTNQTEKKRHDQMWPTDYCWPNHAQEYQTVDK